MLKLNPEAKAPILCFVGPPGVGKTSLGQSIARALGRKFERMSLGGMHDEAELRGHRRTYIGAMPGRIIQAIRRAGREQPGADARRGGQARAATSAATRRRRCWRCSTRRRTTTFRDNYLDLPFDLSKVFFITTANTLDTIPRPLLDRMEILRLSGYSEEEKIEIARRYLIPRQLKETGLTAEQVHPSGRDAQAHHPPLHARGRACGSWNGRWAAWPARWRCEFAEGNDERGRRSGPRTWRRCSGPERFSRRRAPRDLPPGVATGLAWTEAGGDVLYIEATLLPDGKGLTLTGQLGEVMQESAKAAQSYVWSHADEFGHRPRKQFSEYGVHIHVPAGAIPKDGPSAGVTMAVGAGLAVHRSVPVRSDTAMTGEITLTGLVLPIGGIKEKVLAARRAGIKRVILPKPNEKDLRDLPEEVRNEMEFIFVERIEEVLAAALPALATAPAVQ